MEIAKLTNAGQITVPVAIRRKLNMKTGDKIVFIEDGDKIIIANASDDHVSNAFKKNAE